MRALQPVLCLLAGAGLILALAWQHPAAATGDEGKDYPNCASPAWSADGQWIAFASDHADGKYHIWKIRTDGSNLTQITPSSEEDAAPAWSRDGQWIAFCRIRGDGTEIWVMRPDGSQMTQLTEYLGSNASPAWAPNNSRLAFVTWRGDDEDILSMSAGGQEDRYVAASAWNEFDPTWSPDGVWVAYAREIDSECPSLVFNIWKARVGTTERIPVTTGDYWEEDPAWHPTQDLMVFESNRDGSPKLWLVNADGSGLRRVTNQPMSFQEREPCWSPDGSKIAFIGEDYYGGEVWIVNADGTGLTQVTHLTEPQQ